MPRWIWAVAGLALMASDAAEDAWLDVTVVTRDEREIVGRLSIADAAIDLTVPSGRKVHLDPPLAPGWMKLPRMTLEITRTSPDRLVVRTVDRTIVATSIDSPLTIATDDGEVTMAVEDVAKVSCVHREPAREKR